MSQIIGRDTVSNGVTSRLYVWYAPGELPDWENDPALTAYLVEMQEGGAYKVGAHRYLLDVPPDHTGLVIDRGLVSEAPRP